MGRRPGDAESVRTSLAEDDARDLLEFAANLVDQSVARFGVRLASILPLVKQSLDSGSGRPDQPRRAIVEPALPGFTGLRPGGGERRILVQVGRRSTAKRIDQ